MDSVSNFLSGPSGTQTGSLKSGLFVIHFTVEFRMDVFKHVD